MEAEDVGKILETLGRLAGEAAAANARADLIAKEVNGNGQPGIRQRVDDLEASKNRIWGALGAVSFLAGLVEFFLHHK